MVGITEKQFELRLCNNGTYYLWNNNELTDIGFDKFNKESANELVDLLNEQHEQIQSMDNTMNATANYNKFLECKIDNLEEENKQLKEELDYYKNKCVSLEIGLIRVERTNRKLQEENQILRKNLSGKDMEWIRNNTVWEQIPSNWKTYIRTDKND